MTSPRKDDDPQLELGADDSLIALRKAWDRTLRALSLKLNKSTFESFFCTTQPLAIGEDDVVVIGAPSRFAREWLEKRYADTLRSQLQGHLGNPNIQLRFVLAGADSRPILGDSLAQSSGPATSPVEAPEPSNLSVTKRAERWAIPHAGPRRSLPPELTIPLNPRFTFDTFIEGKSNRLAHAGAVAVADRPGSCYNPLFLYGSPGLGKTHLMHAIGHQIRQTNPAARVAFVSGESFANSYITALRERKSDDFRAVYRNVDVWLVDDIQFIAGKEHTKEEFFHTFNTLHQMNRQIVISSDKSPRELRLMDERLRSRFEYGLIADLNPPELEMRVAILQQKAILENVEIPTDVLMYMANLIQSNIRSLEGALIKLMAYASMSQSPVTKQLARDVLGSYFVDRRPIIHRTGDDDTADDDDFAAVDADRSSGLRALPIPAHLSNLSGASFGGNEAFEHIVQTVAAHFSLDPHLIAGDGSAATFRRRELAKPRQIAIFLAREKTSIAVTELARLFGGVSHSAVSHAHTKMQHLLTTDPRLIGLVNEISARL